MFIYNIMKMYRILFLFKINIFLKLKFGILSKYLYFVCVNYSVYYCMIYDLRCLKNKEKILFILRICLW